MSLIRSKLNPPRMAADLVSRPRLVERLEQGRRLPLGLVCAPAGYGKSTLVAGWLEEAGHAFGWLSLDEADSDLSLFVEYLVAAVCRGGEGGATSGACARTLALARGPEPRPDDVASCLVNELEELDDDLVLVLDDYHRIRGTAVHDLMSHLLRYPPRPVHLEILARVDPPLPLASLRAGARMSEIRERDLRFTGEETRAFFDLALETSPRPETLARLGKATEGWAVGLRLAALVGRGRDVDAFLAELHGTMPQLNEYFLAEVLAGQPAERQDGLLRAALVEPFCADLLNELLAPAGDAGAGARAGEALIDWAESQGLFLIVLDAQREWFRFHHLFRGLLLEQLCHRAAAGEIEELRRRAAGWLEARGHLEKAMAQYLDAGDPAAAAELVKRHRHELTRREDWNRLHRWLDALPDELVRRDRELLLIRAWLLENRFLYGEMAEIVERLEADAGTVGAGGAEAELRGEIAALSSARHYLTCDGVRALAASRRALAAIPQEHPSERGFAVVMNILSHQMCGELERAESVALAALKEREGRGSTHHARILIGLAMAYWIDGDAARVARTAGELLARGEELGLPESVAFGRYFLGVARYEQGRPEAAVAALAPLVERRAQPNTTNWAHAAVALALARLAAGDPDGAREIASTLSARGLELQNPALSSLAEAFEAELALRRGRVHEAMPWARSYRPVVRAPRHRFFLPELTLAKALLAEGGDGGRERAAELLDSLAESLTATHHQRFLIDVLGLRALAAERQGQRREALDLVRRAVDIAHPRGLVQPLVDLGPELLRLLGRLDLEEPAASFVQALPEASSQRSPASFPAPPEEVPSAAGSEVDHLSNRELEVLDLLARRLSNKEIASRLCLSPATVKRHNTNIFQKLHVSRRREAVEKARDLGILGTG